MLERKQRGPAKGPPPTLKPFYFTANGTEGLSELPNGPPLCRESRASSHNEKTAMLSVLRCNTNTSLYCKKSHFLHVK